MMHFSDYVYEAITKGDYKIVPHPRGASYLDRLRLVNKKGTPNNKDIPSANSRDDWNLVFSRTFWGHYLKLTRGPNHTHIKLNPVQRTKLLMIIFDVMNNLVEIEAEKKVQRKMMEEKDQWWP